jgi:hypothetical protein
LEVVECIPLGIVVLDGILDAGVDFAGFFGFDVFIRVAQVADLAAVVALGSGTLRIVGDGGIRYLVFRYIAVTSPYVDIFFVEFVQ